MKTNGKEKVQKVKLPGLKKSRKAKELSQRELAKKAGVTHYDVCIVEQHGGPIPQPAAEKIARALGVQLQSLRSSS